MTSVIAGVVDGVIAEVIAGVIDGVIISNTSLQFVVIVSCYGVSWSAPSQFLLLVF